MAKDKLIIEDGDFADNKVTDGNTIEDIQSWREFEKELAEYSKALTTAVEMVEDHFDITPEACKNRRERAIFDYEFFCKSYFPHYTPTDHFSMFHEFAFKRFPARIDSEADARDVYEESRGGAKSTFVTQLGVLWCICRATYIAELIRSSKLPRKARKHMIAIIMNIEEQAAEMLESIKVELTHNARLKADFPDATGQGRIWQSKGILTANDIKIRIGGVGKKLRGMKHGAYRPDLILLDDVENDEQVKSKAQRDKTQDFVLSAVVGLQGPQGGMDIFWVGTSLHYDAAINRVGNAPGWRKKVFRAIMQWPDNMALWEKWEALYTRRGDDDEKDAFEAEAEQFYQDNKEAMHKGAVVSWPVVRPLYKLMCMRAVNHKAFNQEQQNQAGNDEDAPFKGLQFWVNRLPDWIFFGAIDPSLGKKGNVARGGDPSAILVGGFDRKNMVLDVVEADIQRRVPSLIISRAIELQKEYSCLAWAVETVQFQAFLLDQLLKEANKHGIAFPGVPVIPHTDKDLRIMSLQPHINNGAIRTHQHHTTLNEQMTFYPEADHDDGPDGLEMLWTISKDYAGGYSWQPAGGSTRGMRGHDNDIDDIDD